MHILSKAEAAGYIFNGISEVKSLFSLGGCRYFVKWQTPGFRSPSEVVKRKLLVDYLKAGD